MSQMAFSVNKRLTVFNQAVSQLNHCNLLYIQYIATHNLKINQMKYLPLNAGIFKENRARFVARMDKKSIAIFNSNDELPANGDSIHKFRQNSDLVWLTGINQEDTMLILFPDNPDPKYREVLVLVRPNEMKEKWDGHRLRTNEALEISGIKTIVWLDSLDALLQPWIHLSETIYLNTNENDRKANLVPVRDYRYAKMMRQRFPLHNYKRSAAILIFRLTKNRSNRTKTVVNT